MKGEPNMDDSTNPQTRAVAALAEMFFAAVCDTSDLAAFESKAIELGHACIAEAMGFALEALDAKLLADKPGGLRAHDIRVRTLATEVGDVRFDIRRYRDKCGCDVYLLADALDIPYGCRISPGATDFLIEAAAHVSYLKAAALLARHGSSVRATAVMDAMHRAGVLCAEQDEAAAAALYRDGVIPDAKEAAEELCMEADGTYFTVQGADVGSPKKFEVKALCAYAGKEVQGGKVRRRGTMHHACVGSPDELWMEGIAGVGRRYDLSKVKQVHLGADGERWCRDAERFLPCAKVTFHLDPFHINHAIMSCFADTKMAWNVIDVLNDGDKAEAIALLQSCKGLGISRKSRTEAVISYLQGNLDAIAVEGPTLGTMESENQHLYGVRMDSYPCAWSLQGASHMARIISRRASNIAIPKLGRERSMGEDRRKRRTRKELSFYAKKGSAAKVLESVGSGYLPPHQADTRKMSPGKAYALHKAMASMDGRI